MGRRALLLAAAAAAVVLVAAFWPSDRSRRAPAREVRTVAPPPERPGEAQDAPEAVEPATRVVFGRVVDAAGAPVAGATVSLIPFGGDGQADAEGRFEIEVRSGDLVRCAAGAPGHRLALGPWLAFESGDRLDAGTIRLGAGLALAGRVVDPKGTGVAGVDVVLAREGPTSEEWEALLGQFGWQETGEDGRFSFYGLDEGLFRVSVRIYDPASDDDERVTREHLRAGGEEIVFVVPTPRRPVAGTISVVVTLPDGSLLPRGLLRVGTQDSGMSEHIVDGEASATVEGTGPAWLSVQYARDSNDAQLPFRPEYVADVLPREEPYPIVLAPGEAIGGIVATTAGLPLRASVTIMPIRLDDEGGRAVRNLAGENDQVESGADGRFRCVRLAPGRYAVHAACAGHVGVRPFVVARTGDEVRIEMRAAGRILLRLVAPEGDVPGGGTLTILHPGPGGYVEAGTQTVSIGRNSKSPSFETTFDGLREAEVYRIRASVSRRGGGRYAPVEIDAVPGPEAVLVRLRPGRVLAGKVVRPDGTPVAAADVRVRLPLPAGQDWFRHWSADHGQAFSRSGLDGTFELHGVPETPFWLSCGATGLAQSDGPAHVGARETGIEVRMEPALEVSGRLMGDPPLDFRVEAIPLDLAGEAAAIPRDFEFSGADGFFALPGLRRGVVRIDAWRPWGEDDDRYAQAEAVETGSADLRLRVLRGHRLEGTVRDPDGRPVHMATVLLDASWGARSATTDSEGRFVLRALPPGRHLVRVGAGEAVQADAPGPPLHLVR